MKTFFDTSFNLPDLDCSVVLEQKIYLLFMTSFSSTIRFNNSSTSIYPKWEGVVSYL